MKKTTGFYWEWSVVFVVLRDLDCRTDKKLHGKFIKSLDSIVNDSGDLIVWCKETDVDGYIKLLNSKCRRVDLKV